MAICVRLSNSLYLTFKHCTAYKVVLSNSFDQHLLKLFTVSFTYSSQSDWVRGDGTSITKLLDWLFLKIHSTITTTSLHFIALFLKHYMAPLACAFLHSFPIIINVHMPGQHEGKGFQQFNLKILVCIANLWVDTHPGRRTHTHTHIHPWVGNL